MPRLPVPDANKINVQDLEGNELFQGRDPQRPRTRPMAKVNTKDLEAAVGWLEGLDELASCGPADANEFPKTSAVLEEIAKIALDEVTVDKNDFPQGKGTCGTELPSNKSLSSLLPRERRGITRLKE